MYHPGKMYNRPICGRSTGAYTNLGDLQRDLMGVKSHPINKKIIIIKKIHACPIMHDLGKGKVKVVAIVTC
jgi:hypothetical protein